MNDNFQLILGTLFGGLIGALAQRYYDQHKDRDAEIHSLRLALRETRDFDGVLLLLHEEMPGDELGQFLSTFSPVSNENLRRFANSKLAVLLPSEVRSEAKGIADLIDSFNVVGNRKSSQIAVFAGHSKECDAAEVWLLNALFYVCAWKFRVFGFKPKFEEIAKIRTAEEAHRMSLAIDEL